MTMSELPDSGDQRSERGRHTPSTNWRPAITIYHILVVFVTLGTSTTKLALSLRAGSNLVITVLGFILFPVLPIIIYAVDKYSSEVELEKLPWILRSDLCRYLGTNHDTGEKEDLVPSNHVPIRGYDLLYTVFTLLYGIMRASLSYFGLATEAIIFDYISTLFIEIGLFLLGLYEVNPRRLDPHLFLVDYRGS
ncbi:hypothetical protein BDQ17DRAFT_147182 [Cyathus striatus]|nr:hypothetical protein BDQ17DRAFT_147182 [Cyathus striatus]